MAYITGEIHYTGSGGGDKKALSLCILQILADESDPSYPLNSALLRRKLKESYGIEANRNTISRNIQLLCNLGFDISTYEENHQGVYLRTRMFEDMEIRWLIDGVLNSKYMTDKYASDLITKLKRLSNRSFKSRRDHVEALREQPHQRNPLISVNMEQLDEAIETARRVQFFYNTMDCDGKLHNVGGHAFIVLPLQMFCTNFQYYLVGYDFGEKSMWHFRVDRMTNVKLSESTANEDSRLKKNFEPAHYVSQHPHMYAGAPETIIMKMPRSLAGAVYDSFGSAAQMQTIDEISMQVQVRAAPEGMRFFALQYGPNCEVIQPKSLRMQIINDIKSMMERYDG